MKDGQKAVDKAVQVPQGYRLMWGGEYSQFLEAKAQFVLIGPLAVVLIFMILFALYGNFKFPVTIALGVVMTEPVGALIALKLTHTPFSVSSVLGLLALLGVSVETAVILVSYINKLRQEGLDIRYGNARSLSAAASSHHDDGTRRLSRTASGCTLDRNWFRHSEALRHCDCGRFDLATVYRLFREPGAI